MSNKRIFRLVSDSARRLAAQFCMTAPDGWIARVQEPSRTLDQNALIHPVCRAVQRHLELNGAQKRREDWWRHYFVARYAGQEVVPDGGGGYVVMNRCSGTSDMRKAEASDFIEWLHAYGVEIGIDWSQERKAA